MKPGMKIVGVFLAGGLLTPALGQTPSPRTSQSPSQAELLAACQQQATSDRAACEKRVRAGGIPSTGSRNKPASEQQATQPDAQTRGVEDPGVATTPTRTAKEAPTSTRTREDRTRLSQQSEQVKNARAPQRKADPNTSTTAAPTRLGTETADGRATREREASDARKSDERGSPDTPSQDRAVSRPSDNPKKPSP